MQIDDPTEDGDGKLIATRKLFNIIRDDVLVALEQLDQEDGLKERVKGLTEAMGNLKKAALQSIDAEAHFAKISDRVQPIKGSALDLDSAKRDVLERLARLAATKDN